MPVSVRFYFDFVSPYSYLAFTQLPRVARATGASFELVPISVLDLMQRVGNTPTSVTCQAKSRYAREDLDRWARRYGVPLVPHPAFGSFDVEPFLVAAHSAARSGCLEACVAAVFEAIWVESRNLTDESAVTEWFRSAGVDADVLREDAAAGREALAACVDQALVDGVFGVPSFRTDDALFFGNDRLDFLEAALRS